MLKTNVQLNLTASICPYLFSKLPQHRQKVTSQYLDLLADINPSSKSRMAEDYLYFLEGLYSQLDIFPTQI